MKNRHKITMRSKQRFPRDQSLDPNCVFRSCRFRCAAHLLYELLLVNVLLPQVGDFPPQRLVLPETTPKHGTSTSDLRNHNATATLLSLASSLLFFICMCLSGLCAEWVHWSFGCKGLLNKVRVGLKPSRFNKRKTFSQTGACQPE